MHLSHAGRLAPALADSLDNSIGFLVDDCLMGVLKDLLFRWIVVKLFLLLVGFPLGLKVNGVTEAFPSG